MTRKPIKMPKAAKPKKPVTPRVARTRNHGTETEASHFQKIRSALRNMSRWWKPLKAAKDRAKRVYRVGKAKRVEYQCAGCQNWFKEKEIEVNHKIPVGSLRSYADLPGFCERLFVENLDHLEVLCNTCHHGFTHGPAAIELAKTSLSITTETK